MKLPLPVDRLADCVWLPRVIAKARLLLAGELPPEYEVRFAHPTGVDGEFMRWFDLKKEEVLTAAAGSDESVARWFLGRSPDAREKVTAWNDIAVNLGRPGFPLADRLPIGKSTTYAHLDTSAIDTVFDMIALDEKDPY